MIYKRSLMVYLILTKMEDIKHDKVAEMLFSRITDIAKRRTERMRTSRRYVLCIFASAAAACANVRIARYDIRIPPLVVVKTCG